MQTYPKNLTEHFAWAEAEVTNHRSIDNSIPVEFFDAIRSTAHGMERIRTVLGLPISVSSWYRCLELNRSLGSKDSSQHLQGEAVDWICPAFGTPVQVAQKLVKHRDYIRYDQLILEHTWIHTSFQSDPDIQNRQMVLSLLKNGGYSAGITDNMGNPYYA